MENGKRLLTLLLAIFLLFAALAACRHTDNPAEETTASLFGPENESLRVFIRGNCPIAESLTSQFPDIPFTFYYYDGQNTTSAMKTLLENDDIGDIYLGSLQLDDEAAKKHLLKLSGYPFCDNYEISVLNQYDVDGAIYQVPSGIIVRCMVYNRDMFDRHGWKEPQNFSELVALCRQIRREAPDITPIVFGGAALGYYFTTMTTYAQTEFLYTPEGGKWEKAYLAGNASAEDGFGTGIRMVQELIDAGAFDVAKNERLWDNGIFNERMKTGEAAMMFAWGGQESLAANLETSDTNYALMPFRNYAGDPSLGTHTAYSIGLANDLGEPGNEKKLKNAIRVMEWFATKEGMLVLSGNSKSMIYPLKGFSNTHTQADFLALWNDHLNGIKAPMLYTGYEDVLVPAAEKIAEAMQGSGDLRGLAAFIDATHKDYLENGSGAGIAGSFEHTFSHAQTVQLFASILYEKGDSDIALVSDGQRTGDAPNKSGVALRFYKGAFPMDYATCQVPGSPYSDPAVRMSLTGETIKRLLENGKEVVQVQGPSKPQSAESGYPAVAVSNYPYYFSGMTAVFQAGNVVSMNLSSGEVMELDRTYTVTFAANDYTDAIRDCGNPEALGYSCYDALLEYLEVNSPVCAPTVLRQAPET